MMGSRLRNPLGEVARTLGGSATSSLSRSANSPPHTGERLWTQETVCRQTPSLKWKRSSVASEGVIPASLPPGCRSFKPSCSAVTCPRPKLPDNQDPETHPAWL